MPLKILVIDDERAIRTALKILFEKSGYQVLQAENGDEGIRIFNGDTIDLVIVDLIMPEKEGIETIRELKAIDPEAKIIAISGGGIIKPELYLKMAKKFGAIYSFEKPISNKELLAFVKDVLQPPPSL